MEKLKLLFALIRSALSGEKLSDEQKALYNAEILPLIATVAKKHDVLHLIALGLKNNGLINDENKKLEGEIFKAFYRYERLNYELERLCVGLEKAQIPFVPLKGAVIRSRYPEPWMRTSCDIDVLVRAEDLDAAMDYVEENLGYKDRARATHDVSFAAPGGVRVELHFDLLEENRANNAADLLKSVWKNVALCEGCQYKYQMSDEFFYFYHIAHMAKHFENGGCGIRPFVDLWILDNIENADKSARDELLKQSGLLTFAQNARDLSKMWFGEKAENDLLLKMQDFILRGGSYGTTDNRVAAQKKQGGRAKYLTSRVFAPYERLVRYYPVLEKHRWLTPLMQVRRWFMLLNPTVRGMAKSEFTQTKAVPDAKAQSVRKMLDDLGL